MSIDDTDRRLLRLMQANPDLPVAELAARAGLTAGPCWRRLERLRAQGVLSPRKVRIDYRALGLGVQVFLRVTLDKTAPNALDQFLAAARKVPQIEAIQTLLGRVDVRMDLRARDLDHYQQIYKTQVLALPHIADIEALMLVSEVKNTTMLPI